MEEKIKVVEQQVLAEAVQVVNLDLLMVVMEQLTLVVALVDQVHQVVELEVLV